MINPIKKIREDKGMNQSEFAIIMEVPYTVISKWEQGGLILSEKKLEKMAKLMGLDYKEIKKELEEYYKTYRQELINKLKK